MQNKISNKPTNKPQPDVKNQAAGKAPIENWIGYNNKAYGNEPKPITDAERKVGEATEANAYKYESATDRIQEQDRQKKAPRMSASRSWQIIKGSMDKDELEEWYRDHPEDRPMKLAPVEYDKGLTEMLGDDWLSD